jgi:hypothetical protein
LANYGVSSGGAWTFNGTGSTPSYAAFIINQTNASGYLNLALMQPNATNGASVYSFSCGVASSSNNAAAALFQYTSSGSAQNTFGFVFYGSSVLWGFNANATTPLFFMGGTTSSFPAFKRIGTSLSLRLADDSADAAFSAAGVTANGNLSFGDDSVSPTARAVSGQGSRTGTDTNVAGAALTIRPGKGTGNATPGALILQSYVKVASGTGAQTATTTLTLNNGVPVFPSFTVANLPAAATAGAGARAFVTDSNQTTTAGIGTNVAAGGANFNPVYCDGTNWKIG